MRLFRLDLLCRSPQRLVGFAIFLAAAHVGSRVGEGNSRFRHSNEFNGLLRRDRERQRLRVGQSYIFAGENHDAARDEAKVFAGVQHFREPVNRAFLVGSAHALDESTDCIVVRVARAVVDNRFLLDALFGDCDREMDHAIFRFPWRRGEHANFQRVQAFPRIPITHLCQMPSRVGIHLDPILAEAAFGIIQRAVDQFLQLLDTQRLELKNLRARNQRAVHIEKWVVSRSTDQAQISALHIWQENVLLRLVEVMNFVDEQNGFLAGRSKPIRGSRHYPPHLRDVAFHSTEALEFRACHVRDDLRERRFTGAGRAGQNDGRQPVGLNRAPQKFSRREDVFLPDKFFKGARAHAGSERRRSVHRRRLRLVVAFKEILHEQKIRSANRTAHYIRAHAQGSFSYLSLSSYARARGGGIAAPVRHGF